MTTIEQLAGEASEAPPDHLPAALRKGFDMNDHITNDEQLEVCVALERLGIVARHEYPGVVAIEIGNGLEAWTGMHAWTYASYVLDGDEDNEHDSFAPNLKEDETDPDVIARAWAEVVRWIREAS